MKLCEESAESTKVTFFSNPEKGSKKGPLFRILKNFQRKLESWAGELGISEEQASACDALKRFQRNLPDPSSPTLPMCGCTSHKHWGLGAGSMGTTHRPGGRQQSGGSKGS